jgi:hypothetical protein
MRSERFHEFVAPLGPSPFEARAAREHLRVTEIVNTPVEALW